MPSTDPISANPRTTAPGHAIPLLIVALAAASFVSMDSVIKLLAARYDTLQLSFFRFAGGSVFALPLWLWRRTPLPSRGNWRLHLLRSALLLCSLVGYFHALTRLPLALAVTISYLAPIFVAVLSVPLLKEKPSGAIWLALGAGLSVSRSRSGRSSRRGSTAPRPPAWSAWPARRLRPLRSPAYC